MACVKHQHCAIMRAHTILQTTRLYAAGAHTPCHPRHCPTLPAWLARLNRHQPCVQMRLCVCEREGGDSAHWVDREGRLTVLSPVRGSLSTAQLLAETAAACHSLHACLQCTCACPLPPPVRDTTHCNPTSATCSEAGAFCTGTQAAEVVGSCQLTTDGGGCTGDLDDNAYCSAGEAANPGDPEGVLCYTVGAAQLVACHAAQCSCQLHTLSAR